MVTFADFLLLSISLLSHVYANGDSNESVKWLEADRSVLVYLATPDLHFWNQCDQITTEHPGAFLFNFTLTPDNLTLLLNDEPILPRTYPHVPAPLRAHQTGESAAFFAQRVDTNLTKYPVMDLDYYISTSADYTSGTSIYNTKYNPRLQIDILRASIPALPGYSAYLSSNSQNQIWVYLEDLSEHPPNTLYANIPLRIRSVKVDWRWYDSNTQGTATYKTPQSLRTCYIWSWLCADLDNYPYYEYIFRENFDQYGKKGSMRHFLTTRWGNLVGSMGFWQAIVWVAVCGSMVLSPFVYALSRGVKRVVNGMKGVVEVHQKRMREVDEWLADEEMEGLLEGDKSFEDFEEVEKKDYAEGKGDEKTSVKKPLHSSPHVPMKLEKSSIS